LAPIGANFICSGFVFAAARLLPGVGTTGLRPIPGRCRLPTPCGLNRQFDARSPESPAYIPQARDLAFCDAVIDVYDLLHIRPSYIRLYRGGLYPVLRGTCLELEQGDFTIYTRGSVPFFETYPGLYAPRPIRATVALSEYTTMTLARELLALSKLNWNSTQFDGSDPITVRASSEVGSILRFCEPAQTIAPRYSFYM
jgi:hypothetical protein